MPNNAGDAYLDADEIRASTFIRHVEIHETLGSTNDLAAELARDTNIELPALVAARHQTAGRGRGKNIWWSADGSLTFSVLLDPATCGIGVANWPQLSLATAVAVCDALSLEVGWAPPTTNSNSKMVGSAHPTPPVPNPKSGIRNPQSLRLGIKWPNDVMLDGAKVCGILIESPSGSVPAKDRLVIGIGINVNNSRQCIENGPSATTLSEVTGRKHSLQKLFINVLRALEARSVQLAAHDPQLQAAWQQRCWLTEQRVEAHSNGNWIDGVCLGIDSDGTLLVENVFGTHRIRSGSVRVLS